MPNYDELKPTEVAWLAGLLEGEGSFTTRSNGTTLNAAGEPKRYPRIVLAMTDVDVVSKAARMMGSYAPKRHKASTNKPLYWTELGRTKDVAALGRRLLPHLGSRQGQRLKGLMDLAS